MKEFNLNDLGQKPRRSLGQQNWKARTYRKRGKPSQTPGSQKSDACKTNALKSWMSKHGRSWKHPRYGEYCAGKGIFRGIGSD